jgi:Transposase DDE domain
MPVNKSWHDYNESLIQRGRILMDISFLRSSNREIKNMNKGKVGAPYEYSRTYIQFLAFLKIGFKISYRTVQGIVRGLSDYLRIEEIHFTQIRRRILKVKPSVGNLNPDNDDSKPITLIVDASGLTITKKGDYIEQKWIRKKKEFIKLHIAVDAKSESISLVAAAVRDDETDIR